MHSNYFAHMNVIVISMVIIWNKNLNRYVTLSVYVIKLIKICFKNSRRHAASRAYMSEYSNCNIEAIIEFCIIRWLMITSITTDTRLPLLYQNRIFRQFVLQHVCHFNMCFFSCNKCSCIYVGHATPTVDINEYEYPK